MIVLLFVMLFLLIGIGFSIWTAMGISGMAYILIQGDFSLRILVQTMVGGVDSDTLVAIPFFIFVGRLMSRSGITKRLANFADFFVGRFRGGLAYVSIVVSFIMAGVSGSAVADASSVSAVLHPLMKERDYDDEFAAAINSSSAVIGPIFPPSIPMIFISVISGLSLGKLFLGGVIPGIMMAIFLTVMVAVISRKKNYRTVKTRMSLRRLLSLLGESIFALIGPLIVIGGIVFGVVTLVEVAALAVFYFIAVSVFIYRSIKLRDLFSIFKETAVFSASIMIIFAVVGLYQYIVATEQLGDQLLSAIVKLNMSRNLFLLFSTVFFLLMGCILDAVPVMLIFFPVLLPVAVSLGVDPTHYGVIVVLNLMIGLLTPPIGGILFIQAKIAGLDFNSMVRAVWPYTLTLIAVLLLITYLPSLVMIVPNLVFGAN
ncbi:MAG: TRAP transporter large permease [Spirochaetaceae bacterium]|nr:MAG: TRAP transporter large permease [Spirochaetaceae bacterium]